MVFNVRTLKLFATLLLCCFVLSCSTIRSVKQSEPIISGMATGCCSASATNSFGDREIFEWLHYNGLDYLTAEQLERDLDLFRQKLTEGDYLFYKSNIRFSTGNEEDGWALLERADRLGNSAAGEALFQHFYLDNFKEAVKYLTSSAEKGDPFAQFRLGVIYFYGRKAGGNRDIERGLKYFQQSASKGWSQAIIKLNDSDVKEQLDTSEGLFWGVIYRLFEAEDPGGLIQLVSEVKDWGAFCKKLSLTSLDLKLNTGRIGNERFNAIRRIVHNCKSEL